MLKILRSIKELEKACNLVFLHKSEEANEEGSPSLVLSHASNLSGDFVDDVYNEILDQEDLSYLCKTKKQQTNSGPANKLSVRRIDRTIKLSKRKK